MTTQTRPDYAANMALFLLERRDSIFGTWIGTLTRVEQRNLFGFAYSQNEGAVQTTFRIDGEAETVAVLDSAGNEVDRFSWVEL